MEADKASTSLLRRNSSKGESKQKLCLEGGKRLPSGKQGHV